MTDDMEQDFPPDTLEQCIEEFWAKNPDLKKRVLRDWYSGRPVSRDSNMAGLRAVGKWLNVSGDQ